MNFFVLFSAALAIVAATAEDAVQSVEVANDQVPNRHADITEVQSDAVSNSTIKSPPSNVTDRDLKIWIELMACIALCPNKTNNPLCVLSNKGREITLRYGCQALCFFPPVVLHKGECQKPKPSPFEQCLMKAPKNIQPFCIKSLEFGISITVESLGVYQCWKKYRSFQLSAKGRCPEDEDNDEVDDDFNEFTVCVLRCPNLKTVVENLKNPKNLKENGIQVCAKTKKGKSKTYNLCVYRCLQAVPHTVKRPLTLVKVGKC